MGLPSRIYCAEQTRGHQRVVGEEKTASPVEVKEKEDGVNKKALSTG